MVTCIKTNVQINCDEEAAHLVEYLVKPTVKMSEHCRDETSQTSKIHTVSTIYLLEIKMFVFNSGI